MLIQNKLNKDIVTLRKILILHHPELSIDDKKLESMCKNGGYDWVAISGRVKDYGYVDILIDNGHDTTNMYGSGWKLTDFKERQPKLAFSVWRSSMDKLHTAGNYTNFDKEKFEFPHLERVILRPQYTKILTDAGYRTKSAEEWMKEYYSD